MHRRRPDRDDPRPQTVILADHRRRAPTPGRPVDVGAHAEVGAVHVRVPIAVHPVRGPEAIEQHRRDRGGVEVHHTRDGLVSRGEQHLVAQPAGGDRGVGVGVRDPDALGAVEVAQRSVDRGPACCAGATPSSLDDGDVTVAGGSVSCGVAADDARRRVTARVGGDDDAGRQPDDGRRGIDRIETVDDRRPLVPGRHCDEDPIDRAVLPGATGRRSSLSCCGVRYRTADLTHPGSSIEPSRRALAGVAVPRERGRQTPFARRGVRSDPLVGSAQQRSAGDLRAGGATRQQHPSTPGVDLDRVAGGRPRRHGPPGAVGPPDAEDRGNGLAAPQVWGPRISS